MRAVMAAGRPLRRGRRRAARARRPRQAGRPRCGRSRPGRWWPGSARRARPGPGTTPARTARRRGGPRRGGPTAAAAAPRPTAGGVRKYDNHYGDDPANLASRGLDELLDGFTQILAGCRALLRPGGLAVITTRPWREHGELVDLPAAVLAAAARAGLIPAAGASRCSPGCAAASSSPGRRSSSCTTCAKPGARRAVAPDRVRGRDHRPQPPFPGSSRELEGPQRELEGPAPRYSHVGPGDADELGAAE
jgi:hypothetical protein